MSDIIGNIYKQNCGDILFVIEKILEGDNKNKYKCQFQKYPYIVFAQKQKIEQGTVNNPQIEQVEFINKEWYQSCGDTLKVLEKSKEKTKTGIALFRCCFKNFPCEVLGTKRNIQKGEINNPRLELEKYIGKIFDLPQGKFYIESKTKEVYLKEFLWVGYFLNDYNLPSTKIKFRKSQIIQKTLSNPDTISKREDFLKAFIKSNYLNKKPTLVQLAKDTNICLSHLTHRINEFGLRDYVEYSKEGSFMEEDLRYFVKSLNKNTLDNSIWTELDGKEIDIYIPDLKFGIEFNGNYWHSNIYKDSNYHQEKSLLAQKQGIQLIHIWEYEWLEKQEIIKSLIKSKLGIFDQKIGASKCKIKELDYKTYAAFCNENHLQGECGAKVRLGLFYKDELIQIMSFSKPRFTSNFEWEIIRECSKQNIFVIGGKNKLWNYFVKKYIPNNCISYCDFSKFTGSSYLKLGFKKERLNKPGFVWWNEQINEIYWRNPYKHQEMKKYNKIYDCGQLVFSWFNNN